MVIKNRRAIRVLHLIEDFGFGGAERLLTTLLPALRERGLDVEVLALGARDALAGELRAAGVVVHQGGFRGTLPSWPLWAWLRTRLTERPYDVLHTHLTRANILGRLAHRRGALTCTYHAADYEPEVLQDNPGQSQWKTRVYRYADALTARRCHRVVAVSNWVKRSTSKHLALRPGDITTIYNGVPIGAFTSCEESIKRAARRHLGIPPEARVVLQVGRLTRQKGWEQTVAAASRLKGEIGVRWLFVGEGPLRRSLEGQCLAAGLGDTVELRGASREVGIYLAAADVFVFPSRSEGFGIAAVEAMARGLPVVALRSGPLPEVVVDQETGLLVEPGDAAALAAAIRTLLRDPLLAASLGERGRARAIACFAIEKVAAAYGSFYDDLLRKGHKVSSDLRKSEM